MVLPWRAVIYRRFIMPHRKFSQPVTEVVKYRAVHMILLKTEFSSVRNEFMITIVLGY